MEVASLQAIGEPVPSTDEVQPTTKGGEPIMETVGAPTLEADQAPEGTAQERADTERETVLVSKPSSPGSTADTAEVAGKAPAGIQVVRRAKTQKRL
jgi:hypothetical protein